MRSEKNYEYEKGYNAGLKDGACDENKYKKCGICYWYDVIQDKGGVCTKYDLLMPDSCDRDGTCDDWRMME